MLLVYGIRTDCKMDRVAFSNVDLVKKFKILIKVSNGDQGEQTSQTKLPLYAFFFCLSTKHIDIVKET